MEGFSTRMADDSPAYQGIHSPFVPTGAQVRDRPDANDIEVGMTGKQVTQALYGEVSEMRLPSTRSPSPSLNDM